MKIKEIRHAVLGISFNPTGDVQGAMPVAEASKFISEAAQGFDEVQTHIIRPVLDERGNLSFVLNEYIFIKYEDVPVAVLADAIAGTKTKKVANPS